MPVEAEPLVEGVGLGAAEIRRQRQLVAAGLPRAGPRVVNQVPPYPKFTLDQRIDPAAEGGLLMRARIAKPNRGVAIMANPNQPDSFWCDDLFPADGAWLVVYVPFAELKPGPGGAGMQNSRLAPESWTTLALGMGGTTENTYELSHFLVVGGSGAE